jgi:hypothetical protein
MLSFFDGSNNSDPLTITKIGTHQRTEESLKFPIHQCKDVVSLTPKTTSAETCKTTTAKVDNTRSALIQNKSGEIFLGIMQQAFTISEETTYRVFHHVFKGARYFPLSFDIFFIINIIIHKKAFCLTISHNSPKAENIWKKVHM